MSVPFVEKSKQDFNIFEAAVQCHFVARTDGPCPNYGFLRSLVSVGDLIGKLKWHPLRLQNGGKKSQWDTLNLAVVGQPGISYSF